MAACDMVVLVLRSDGHGTGSDLTIEIGCYGGE